jgi:hypothetical protein
VRKRKTNMEKDFWTTTQRHRLSKDCPNKNQGVPVSCMGRRNVSPFFSPFLLTFIMLN